MALGDAIGTILDIGSDNLLNEADSWIRDQLGLANTPLERLKANIGGFTKNARFAVIITPPPTMKVGSNSSLSNITMACSSVSGLAHSFATFETRQSEMIPVKMPNDQIYPDVTMTFFNTIVWGSLNAVDFFELWMEQVKDESGFGFYDDYVSTLQVQQYGDDGGMLKEYKITNFYPIALVPDALAHSTPDTLQTFQVTGTWF